MKGLPPLRFTRTTNISKEQIEFNIEKVPYKYGTQECKNFRSKTTRAVAKAMAEQWG